MNNKLERIEYANVVNNLLHLYDIIERLLSRDTNINLYGNTGNYIVKPTNNQQCPIILSQNCDVKYYVDGNGNHRVILYKIMMLSEIANKYPYACSDDYDLTFEGFEDVQKKYWLNARFVC